MTFFRSILIVALPGAIACGSTPSVPPGDGGPVPEVPAYRVGAGPSSSRYEATGAVRSLRRAELATRLMGTVLTVRVRAGERVTAGQMLLTLEAGSSEAGAAQTRAGLDLAARTLRRMERLHADSAIPTAQLDAARAAYTQAEGQARAAEVELGYSGLRAPFAGVVVARLADPGDLASPGRPLLVIEDTGAMEIIVGLPDNLVAGVRVGLMVPVRLGSDERRVEARVVAIVPVADPGSRTVEVRLSTPTRLASGTSAIAEFSMAPGRGLRVPVESLVRRGQLTGVFVLALDSTARLRWIRIGRAEGGSVEVLAGLADGDLVGLRPAALTDGARARPRVEGGTP